MKKRVKELLDILDRYSKKGFCLEIFGKGMHIEKEDIEYIYDDNLKAIKIKFKDKYEGEEEIIIEEYLLNKKPNLKKLKEIISKSKISIKDDLYYIDYNLYNWKVRKGLIVPKLIIKGYSTDDIIIFYKNLF